MLILAALSLCDLVSCWSRNEVVVSDFILIFIEMSYRYVQVVREGSPSCLFIYQGSRLFWCARWYASFRAPCCFFQYNFEVLLHLWISFNTKLSRIFPLMFRVGESWGILSSIVLCYRVDRRPKCDLHLRPLGIHSWDSYNLLDTTEVMVCTICRLSRYVCDPVGSPVLGALLVPR